MTVVVRQEFYCSCSSFLDAGIVVCLKCLKRAVLYESISTRVYIDEQRCMAMPANRKAVSQLTTPKRLILANNVSINNAVFRQPERN